MKPKNSADVDDHLRFLLGRLADGSLKVGIQGLDANRWPASTIQHVYEIYADYVEQVRQTLEIDVPPVDIWGGGQTSQVPRFLSEDPYENLSKLNAIGNGHPIKCIHRGRQGFGFLPCASAVQDVSLREAARRGVSVFRTFDPLNNPQNLRQTLEVINAVRREQMAQGVRARNLARSEALVFYVHMEMPREAKANLEQIASYAVEVSRLGAHEIAIADYASQVTSPATLSKIHTTIRNALDQNGFESVDVNLFSQGCGADVVVHALQSGIKHVDTAIGDLSGPLSNPDIFQVIDYYFSETIGRPVPANHPTLKALRRVETSIARFSRLHSPYRHSQNEADLNNVRKSKLAFNALSALQSAIAQNWYKLHDALTKKAYGPISKSEREKLFLTDVLKETSSVWAMGGKFNLVSPFGFVCSFQAERLVRARLSNTPVTASLFQKEFRKVVNGRYGANTGIEHGRGDVALAKMFHIYEFVEHLRTCSETVLDLVLSQTCLGDVLSTNETDPGRSSIYQCEFTAEGTAAMYAVDPQPLIKDIQRLAIDATDKAALVKCLTPGVTPVKDITLADCTKNLAAIGIDIPEDKLFQRIADGLNRIELLALYTELFRVDEIDPFVVARSLSTHRIFNTQSDVWDNAKIGRPYDRAFSEEITKLSELNAKRRTLRRFLILEPVGQNRIFDSVIGLRTLSAKIQETYSSLESSLKVYESDRYWAENKKFKSNAFAVISKHVSDKTKVIEEKYLMTPPRLWSQTL